MGTPHGTANTARSEATREAMLAAGRQLLLEEPVSGAFSHLTAGRVASSAGRTTGALFHQWATLDDFLHDLLARLFDPSESHTFDRFSARTAEVAGSGGSLAEGVIAAATEALEVLPQDPHSVAELLAWNRGCRDESFRLRVAKLYPRLDRVGGEFISGLLEMSGREMRPPYTEETFAAICAGVLQGLAIRTVLTPGFYPPDVAGHVLLALVPVFTRLPDDATDVPTVLWRT
jgi:AcrR family transcriptional regulator